MIHKIHMKQIYIPVYEIFTLNLLLLCIAELHQISIIRRLKLMPIYIYILNL